MSAHNTLCWYSDFQVSPILDYTVPCTACLCGSECEVCRWFSSRPATYGWSPSEVEVGSWPPLNCLGGTCCHTTRWSFSLTPWTVMQMQIASKPAQSGKPVPVLLTWKSTKPKKIKQGAQMGINGRMHVLIWQVSMIRYLLVEGLPSVNVATTTDNKKMTPCPFLQFLSGAGILVALSPWCIIFISVVYDGRNVWVLSDHSWNTCMYTR